MRSVIGFLSALAFGVLLAGVLFVAGSSTIAPATFKAVGGKEIDLVSLLAGLVLGVIVSHLARISWTELPLRAADWLLANERNFYRLGWAAFFLAILLFY